MRTHNTLPCNVIFFVDKFFFKIEIFIRIERLGEWAYTTLLLIAHLHRGLYSPAISSTNGVGNDREDSKRARDRDEKRILWEV